MVTEVKPLFEKASAPIEITDEGTFIDTKLLHSLKARDPIPVKEEGLVNSTEASWVHPWKTPNLWGEYSPYHEGTGGDSMDVTDEGMVTIARDLQY